MPKEVTVFVVSQTDAEVNVLHRQVFDYDKHVHRREIAALVTEALTTKASVHTFPGVVHAYPFKSQMLTWVKPPPGVGNEFGFSMYRGTLVASMQEKDGYKWKVVVKQTPRHHDTSSVRFHAFTYNGRTESVENMRTIPVRADENEEKVFQSAVKHILSEGEVN